MPMEILWFYYSINGNGAVPRRIYVRFEYSVLTLSINGEYISELPKILLIFSRLFA